MLTHAQYMISFSYRRRGRLRHSGASVGGHGVYGPGCSCTGSSKAGYPICGRCLAPLPMSGRKCNAVRMLNRGDSFFALPGPLDVSRRVSSHARRIGRSRGTSRPRAGSGLGDVVRAVTGWDCERTSVRFGMGTLGRNPLSGFFC